jgi:WD40 repeat protein
VLFPDAVGEVADWTPLRLPDGRDAVLTGGVDGTLRWWDPATGRPLRAPVVAGHLSGRGLRMPVRQVVALASPRGPLAAVRSEDDLAWSGPTSPVGVWEVATGAPVCEITAPADELYELVVVGSGDRELLGFVSGAGPVACVDPLTGESAGYAPPDAGTRVRPRLDDPPGGVADLVAGPVVHLLTLPPSAAGGELVVSVHEGEDGAAVALAWDPLTGAPAGPLPFAVPDGAVAVAGPGGRTLLAGGEGGRLVVRDVTTGATAGGPVAAHPTGITAVRLLRAADGRQLLATAGTTPGRVIGPLPDAVRLWDAATAEPLPAPVTCHATVIATVPRPGAGDLLACAGDEGPVRVLDPVTGVEHGAGFKPLHDVVAMAVLRGPGGRTLVVTADALDREARVFDLATGDRLATLTEAYPEALAAFPLADGTDALLTTDAAARVTLWDPATGARLAVLADHAVPDAEHGHVATTLATAPDGRPALVTGGADGTVRRWEPFPA